MRVPFWNEAIPVVWELPPEEANGKFYRKITEVTIPRRVALNYIRRGVCRPRDENDGIMNYAILDEEVDVEYGSMT